MFTLYIHSPCTLCLFFVGERREDKGFQGIAVFGIQCGRGEFYSKNCRMCIQMCGKLWKTLSLSHSLSHTHTHTHTCSLTHSYMPSYWMWIPRTRLRKTEDTWTSTHRERESVPSSKHPLDRYYCAYV